VAPRRCEDGKPDLERELTPKGHEQAHGWRSGCASICRPRFQWSRALRCGAQQTAAALGVQVEIDKALAPGASVKQILAAVNAKKNV